MNVTNWWSQSNYNSSDKEIGRGRLHPDFYDQFRIDVKEEKVRKDVLNLLDKFSEMWASRLGKADIAKHRIELMTDARPIF